MSTLRVLVLEDNTLDAELISQQLTTGDLGPCHFVRVQTRADFESALAAGGWDLILADYSLPTFDGLSALDLARRQAPEVPFLFVSGAMGEEVAIESLKRGATDYVLKDRLERLVPAVRRALGEARDRAERRALQEALAQRAEELARADRRKDEFLAMLAHELRNPLAPIRNGLQIMRIRGIPDPTTRQVWEIMSRQVEHLSTLVDDLLDVSRITRGKIQLRPQQLDLASAIRTALDATIPLIESRSHVLRVRLAPDPLWVSGDPVRLAQVVTNLLTNAAKYTDPGGEIEVTAAAEGLEAVIRVRDTGIGISADAQDGIFDLFVQTDQSLDRSQGGLGIGLTLARRLMEMHGGSVGVASDGPGLGSTFTVRLPLSRPAGPGAAATNRHLPGPDCVGRRILVVDDNRDGAESLALLLRTWGHDPSVAFDGATALQLIKAVQPELVLLDIALPKLDGFQVALAIRENEQRRTCLVALTGYAQEDDRQRCLDAGFDDHLAKPVDPGRLRAVIGQSRPGG